MRRRRDRRKKNMGDEVVTLVVTVIDLVGGRHDTMNDIILDILLLW